MFLKILPLNLAFLLHNLVNVHHLGVRGLEICAITCFIADRFEKRCLCFQYCNWELNMCMFFCVQVFEFLIRRHSADSSEEEEVFPFIRTLLHFDTREFLNVLAMVRMIITIVVT